MQFHLEGYRSGDPLVAEPVTGAGERPAEVDVLIVGCGPAGLTLAAQLSAFPDITVRIADRKDGPLEVGQADGIACRSIEMFQAFGFAEKVTKEGYWVNEVAFWRPGADGTGLNRADRIQDVADDLSEMPHVILNQARVHQFYLDIMANSARRLTPEYNRELLSVSRDDNADFPVEARFRRLDDDGGIETVRARYVVGCDGARSTVRRAMGYDLHGKSARQLWGVMDFLPVTDFPDIRLKCAIQSADEGSILIIPREGGYLTRMYIELDELHGEERAADRNVTAELLIAQAKRILAPYTLDVKDIAWWSAYEIGQRVCDRFDDAGPAGEEGAGPRLFIAGDACHTHSPKAGQGMNVSMADTFNLGWKLAAVLRGQSDPALLRSYSEERQAKAQELIDFDRDMARLFSEKPKTDEEAAQFQAYFQQHGRYTAGVETRYDPSGIIGDDSHQALATGYPVGKRFQAAPVIRTADAKPMQLSHCFVADGRWHVVLFAPEGDGGAAGAAVAKTCDALAAVGGPIRRVTPEGADIDSIIDVRAVFQIPHREMRIEALPPLLLPQKGPFGLTDYEKAFSPDPGSADIYALRGIDRARGAMMLVRPDLYVAQVLPLDAVDDLAAFLAPVLTAV